MILRSFEVGVGGGDRKGECSRLSIRRRYAPKTAGSTTHAFAHSEISKIEMVVVIYLAYGCCGTRE